MSALGEPDCGDGPLSFRDRPAPAGTVVRSVRIPPGGELAYERSEWTGALVIVEAGELELECRDGTSRCFGRGSIMCLDWIGLRSARNTGRETVHLSCVTRSTPVSSRRRAATNLTRRSVDQWLNHR